MGEIVKNRRPKVNVSSSASARERLRAHAKRNIEFKEKGETLVMCLDGSGSMWDAFDKKMPRDIKKIDALKKAAFVLIEGSDDQHCLIGAVRYSTAPAVLSLPTRNFEELKLQITGMTVGGMTLIGDALECCVRELGETQHNRIILVTDGREGGAKQERRARPIVERVVKPASVVVDCIALGDNADVDLLQWIAKFTGGVFFHPKTPEDLNRDFLRLESRNRKLLTAGG